MHPKASTEHGQIDHTQEVHGQLLEPRRRPSVLLNPDYAPLYDLAAPVGRAVEVRVATLALSSRDHGLYPAAPQVAADPTGAVRLITGETPRPSARAATTRPLDLHRL